ncbi:MAG: PAS domain S-box protein, partial [Hydrogenophaga sp.]|nr:PAS domain S-box protein [Hydrogenophaga sp.]
MIPLPSPQPHPTTAPASTRWWKHWWRKLPPSRQDRFATLAPLLSVLLFLSAIVVAITYLRFEELEREQEAVTRDVEYAQQRLRLRLLERQEQLMRLAREVDNKEISNEEFEFQVESLISQFPELLAISWVDGRRNVLASYASPSAPPSLIRLPGSTLAPNETDGSFDLARDLRQPIYSRPLGEEPLNATLMLQVPLSEQGRFAGTVMGEYSIDGLMRFGIPPEVMARYAVALLDDRGRVLAGSLQSPNAVLRLLPWSDQPLEHEVAVSPVGNGLILKAQGYRTSQDIVGSGFFWVIGALSALTVWMLLGTWRHTRRRVQAQQALVAETNFRRAMENSMLTGMRALDIQGRITYVNPAFCSMTGWTESELVGRTAPFPYWPDDDHDQLTARLEDELSGRSTPGGFEVRVQRRDGSIFDARMYVSPLIDPKGHQTGWMTSMTDITEPKRIREELSASYERFTTVLESLDSAVSVAPLGSDEML